MCQAAGFPTLSLSLGVAAPARSCAEDPCGPGTCQETAGHVTCLCPPGHTGEHCDIGKPLIGEGGDSFTPRRIFRQEEATEVPRGSGLSDWEGERGAQ